MKILVICIVACLVFCGCDIGNSRRGFLSNYRWLKPVSSNNSGYINRLELRNYSKFVVDPVEVGFIDVEAIKENDGKDLTIGDIKEFAEYLHYAIVREVSKDYEITDEHGPGIAKITVAITDLRKLRPVGRRNAQFTALELRQFRSGRVTVEGEIVDSQTGVQLAADAVTYRGRCDNNWQEWADVEAGLDCWARTICQRIDQAHATFASSK